MFELKPVKYYVREDVYLENRDPEGRFPKKGSWAITVRMTFCVNKALELEWEPMPSGRDDAFLERCRFTFEDAIKYLENYIKMEGVKDYA